MADVDPPLVVYNATPGSERRQDFGARELKISRETARYQLKPLFAKTDTHRQSELVALLMQVSRC
jgi:hypothetical protein